MDYTLLVMLLKDLVILPFQEIKLELKDEISKKIIKLSSKKYNSHLLVVSPTNYSTKPSISDLPAVGVTAYIKNKIELPTGNLRVTLRGEKRVRILNYASFNNDIINARVTDIILPKFESIMETVVRKKLRETLHEYIDSTPSVSNSILKTVNDNDNLDFLTDAITTFIPIDYKKKLEYMVEINPEKRAISLIKDINEEMRYLELEEKIDNNVQIKLSKEQEEYYLKEKLREIEKSLGSDIDGIVYSEYLDKLKKAKLDKKTNNKILLEIEKLEKTNISSPDYSVTKNYLDWVLNLPWHKASKENLNTKNVLDYLNKTHYGLIEVKDRIEEYINAKNLNKNVSSFVICLVGPPGVGKTTISESIAASLGREFYKVSVGGLNDSTELVGNRRTYLGALPGKIIQGIRKCNTNNPVILIDEVDKMVKDYKGDPASSLLDILDSEQNQYFVDNYIEEPFDLSNVIFILTANNKSDIPYPLSDRLDIIELSSYTVFEKLDIAKKYILPRLYKEFNVKKFNFKDEIIINIITNYTKEAGVRALTRYLRKLLIKKLTLKSLTVTKSDLVKYLKDEYIDCNSYEILYPGIVNALAYTPLGGSIIQIETSIYDGKEEIITSGSLGDVLKESIKVAISFLKEKYHLEESLLNKSVHVHILDASTKKEGPSCGVAIVTSILSKLLDQKINDKTAFTGELTLKGNVLKVGGLKEKLISAYNNGIKKVYIPLSNENDLKDIPKYVLNHLEIIKISNYDDVYKEIFK